MPCLSGLIGKTSEESPFPSENVGSTPTLDSMRLVKVKTVPVGYDEKSKILYLNLDNITTLREMKVKKYRPNYGWSENTIPVLRISVTGIDIDDDIYIYFNTVDLFLQEVFRQWYTLYDGIENIGLIADLSSFPPNGEEPWIEKETDDVRKQDLES